MRQLQLFLIVWYRIQSSANNLISEQNRVRVSLYRGCHKTPHWPHRPQILVFRVWKKDRIDLLRHENRHTWR